MRESFTLVGYDPWNALYVSPVKEFLVQCSWVFLIRGIYSIASASHAWQLLSKRDHLCLYNYCHFCVQISQHYYLKKDMASIEGTHRPKQKLGIHINPGWRETQFRLSSCPRMLPCKEQWQSRRLNPRPFLIGPTPYHWTTLNPSPSSLGTQDPRVMEYYEECIGEFKQVFLH